MNSTGFRIPYIKAEITAKLQAQAIARYKSINNKLVKNKGTPWATTHHGNQQ